MNDGEESYHERETSQDDGEGGQGPGSQLGRQAADRVRSFLWPRRKGPRQRGQGKARLSQGRALVDGPCAGRQASAGGLTFPAHQTPALDVHLSVRAEDGTGGKKALCSASSYRQRSIRA